jgi:hypothetical protein
MIYNLVKLLWLFKPHGYCAIKGYMSKLYTQTFPLSHNIFKHESEVKLKQRGYLIKNYTGGILNIMAI